MKNADIVFDDLSEEEKLQLYMLLIDLKAERSEVRYSA